MNDRRGDGAPTYRRDPRGPAEYQRPRVYTEDGDSQAGYGWMAERGDRPEVGGPGDGRPEQDERPGTGAGYAGRGPKGYRRSDDRMREDVCEALTQHPLVDASDIEVEVGDGEVTLTGTVADRQQKRFAEDAADAVFGIRDVHNRLRVRQGGEQSPAPPTGIDRPGQAGRGDDGLGDVTGGRDARRSGGQIGTGTSAR